MDSLIIISADPGITTGFAIHQMPIKLLLEEGQVGALRETKYKIGQYRAKDTSEAVEQFLELGRQTWDKLVDDDSDVFVLTTEGFVLQMFSKDPALLEPVRFNAVLFDRLRGSEQKVEVQMASDAKNTITDQRLRLWGIYKPGADHARDAQRHGLLFARRFASSQKMRERHGWEE